MEKDVKPRGSIHFIPELCHVHHFPASMWRQTVWIPSIFYRLNSLLLADELRIEIQTETGLGHELPLLNSGTEKSSFHSVHTVKFNVDS